MVICNKSLRVRKPFPVDRTMNFQIVENRNLRRILIVGTYFRNNFAETIFMKSRS